MENYIVYLSAFVLLCYCSQESDTCADIHKGCELLAKRGMCLKREAFMTKACPKSCDLCHDDITEKEIKDINAIELLKEKRGTCFDKRRDCDILNRLFNWCRERKDTMQASCRKTCHFCKKNIPKHAKIKNRRKHNKKSKSLKPKKKKLQTKKLHGNHKTVTPCRDKRSNCKTLSVRNKWCIKRRKIMQLVCARTCGFCQAPTTERITTLRPTLTSGVTKQLHRETVKSSRIFKKYKIIHGRPLKGKKKLETLLNKNVRNTVKPRLSTVHKKYRIQIRIDTCRNKIASCSLLKKRGWCKKRVNMMNKYCAKSGNRCFLNNQVKRNNKALTTKKVPTKTADLKISKRKTTTATITANITTTIQTQTQTRQMMSSTATRKPTSTMITPKKQTKLSNKSITLQKQQKHGVCKDEIKSCHVLKAKKMCNHLVMEKKCRKTCNFCGPNCADKQKACPRMKKLGYCESKKDLMDKICQSTCGRCSDSSVSPNEGPEAYSANSVMSQFKSNKASTCKNKLADARCEYYAHVGWCGKNAQITEKCHRTCVCEYKKPVESKAPQSCNDSKYGCCSDKVTLKGDSDGTNCPGCKNDPRFEVLCGRFGDDCNSDGHLGISLRKYCLKTCQLC